MTTRIVVVSTAYGLATAVAALDSGLLAPCERTVLLVTDNTAMPEATPELAAVAGVGPLYARFDAVHHYNDAIEPLHPSGWHPRTEDLPLIERYLRTRWSLGTEPVRLVAESVAVNPTLSLCRIFADAAVEIFADGLMSYGPTRNPLPDTVAVRIEKLLHLDLVPGLRPVLLSEWDVPPVIIPDAALRTVIDVMAGADVGGEPAQSPVALVLGQYLSAGGLLTEAEEVDLYTRLIIDCAAAGHRVVFKAHPSAPWAHRVALTHAGRTHGVELEFAADLELAESLFARGAVALVAGCFSTAMITAQKIYGLPVVRHGTDLLLERLTPYQNSNRVPVTIVDAIVAASGPPGAIAPQPPPDLDALVVAVSYAMQPQLLQRRRADAVAFLTDHYDRSARYFKRRRLTSLDLPGALPAKVRAAPLLVPTPPASPPSAGPVTRDGRGNGTDVGHTAATDARPWQRTAAKLRRRSHTAQ